MKTKIKKNLKFYIIFFAIFFFGISIRLYYFNGIRGHDDWVYLFYIRSFIESRTKEMFSSDWGIRLLLIFPIIILFKLFNPSFFLAFMPTFILSIGNMVLVYLISYYIFKNKTVSLIAMFLFSFYPLNVFVSTIIRGDAEVSFYTSMSLLLFLISRDVKLRVNSLKSKILLIMSGLSIGFAYSVKELSFITLFFYFILFLIESFKKKKFSIKKIEWDYAFIVFGFILFLIFESIFFKAYTGNWFQRITIINTHFKVQYEMSKFVDSSIEMYYVPCLLFDIHNEYCKKLVYFTDWNNTYTPIGMFFIFSVLSSIYLFYKRDKASYILMLWIVVMLIYIEFGSANIFAYVPIHKEPRYFTIISAPMLILIARSIYLFVKDKKSFKKKIFVVIIIFYLFYSSILILNEYHSVYIMYLRFNDEIYEFFLNKTNKNIWTESYLYQYLDLKYNYKLGCNTQNFKNNPGYGFLNEISFFDCNTNNTDSYIVFTNDNRDIIKSVWPDKICLWDRPNSWILERNFTKGEYFATIYHIT